MNADLIKSYLSMVRTYYFEGAYQLNSVRIDGSLITNHITELFSNAQAQIKHIVDNL